MSCSKLALLTTNPPPLHLPTPPHTHTHDESVSRVSALPRHALFQWSGSGWRLSGADYTLGAYQLFLLLITVWLGVRMTHSNSSDKKICWHVREGAILTDVPVSSFYLDFFLVCVCSGFLSLLNFFSIAKQIFHPPLLHWGAAEISETDISKPEYTTLHLLGELNLKMSWCHVCRLSVLDCKIARAPHAVESKGAQE